MGLFSGLESLGLGKMKGTEIFEKEEKKDAAEANYRLKQQRCCIGLLPGDNPNYLE